MPSLAGESVRFDAGSHTYRVGDRTLLSVTQILRIAGVIDEAWYSAWARDRGTYVHQMLEWHDRKDLDESTLDPALRPYLDAYRRFLAESGFVIDRIEERYADPVRGFAGTVDRLGRLGRDVAILDIKTGQPEPWHGLQTAGYAHLVYESTACAAGLHRIQRFGLHLSADRTYRLVSHTDRDDYKVFDAARVVAQWRMARAA